MKLIRRKILLAILLLIAGINIGAQNGESLSLLTVSPGSEAFTVFGHTAIRYKNSMSNIDIVFDFGVFNSREKNFIFKFLKGNAKYSAKIRGYKKFAYAMKYHQRDVIEQKLYIDPITLRNKVRQLFKYSNPNYKDFLYDYQFVKVNCTTKIRDIIIDKNNSENLKGNSFIKELNNLKKINNFSNSMLVELLNLCFGVTSYNSLDKYEQLFLPLLLSNYIDNLEINNKNLVDTTETIVNKKDHFTNSKTFKNLLFVLLFLFVFTVPFLFKYKVSRYIYLTILALLFIIITWLTFYSNRELLNWNMNPFWILIIMFNIIYNNKILKIVWCILLLTFSIFFIINGIYSLLITMLVFSFWGFVCNSQKNKQLNYFGIY
jgi:hypothetical protein